MKTSVKLIAFILVIIALGLLNFIGSLIPGKLDLTEGKFYTLTDGSKALIQKIEEPVTLRLFFSRSMSDLPISFKNYADRVEDFLKQYVSASDGLITLEIIDPKPDTPSEDDAIRFGLNGQPGPGGDPFYFGLIAQQADRQVLIPLIDPNRESFLEYDISQLIYQVGRVEKLKLGITSQLPVFAQFTGQFNPRNMPRDWYFVGELGKNYEIVEVYGDPLPKDLDILAIIHPTNLSDKMLYEIDQFILSGKPVFIAVDPSSVFQRESMQDQMMMAPMAGSNLPKLFEKYGIEYNASRITGDLEYATPVGVSASSAPISYPLWLSLTRFEQTIPVTADLKQLLFVDPGSFSLTESSPLELMPLIQSSERSGTVDVSAIMYSTPDAIAKSFSGDNVKRTFAGILSGKLSTAFPDGPPVDTSKSDAEGEPAPAPDLSNHISESKGTSTIFLVADSDFLVERFSMQIMNLGGAILAAPINDNMAFVSNAIDYLSGSSDLVSLRSKGQISRPFTVVNKMLEKAQAEYQAKLDALEARLTETQNKIRELQRQEQDAGKLVASPEIQAAIDKFRQDEADMRAERRDIRQQLRADIERLKVTLSMINLLVVPVALGIFGVVFFIRRNSRQRSIAR